MIWIPMSFYHTPHTKYQMARATDSRCACDWLDRVNCKANKICQVPSSFGLHVWAVQMLRCAAKCTSLLAQYTPGQWVDVGEISMRTRYFIFKFIHLSWRFCRSWFFGLCYEQTQLALHCIDWFVRGVKTAKGATNFMRKVWFFVSMESASADDVRARGSPKGLVLAPLQAQAQHYPKGEGWKRSQFGSRKRSQTDAPTDNDHINRVWTSTPWRPILRMYLHYVT